MRKFSIDVTLSLVLAFGLALQASALGISYTGGCDYSFTLAPDQDNFFHKDCNITSSIQTTTIRLESHEDFAAIDVSPGSIFFFYNDVKLDEVTIRNNFEKAFLEIFDNIGHSTTFFTYDSARYIENDQALNLTFTLDPSGFT